MADAGSPSGDVIPLRLTVPNVATFQPVAAVITIVAIGLIFLAKWPVLRVLATCAGLGVAAVLVGLPVT